MTFVVADSPDWSDPSGTSPAQLIGEAVNPSGVLALGSDGTDARALLVDATGALIVAP